MCTIYLMTSLLVVRGKGFLAHLVAVPSQHVALHVATIHSIIVSLQVS